MIMLRILLIAILTSTAFAQRWKLRAREHFETHTVTMNNNDYIYKGLSNTVNVYYEVPFKYSIGFALSPVLPDLSNLKQKTSNSPLGDRITLTTYGLEIKFHIGQFFIRPGIGYAYLKSDEVDKKMLVNSHILELDTHEFQFNHFGLGARSCTKRN